jgi:hypothetical protein
VECPLCSGKGCDECDKGSFRVTRCPQLEVTGDVFEAIELAGMMRKGLPPIAGGALDQAQQFLEGARMIWNEMDYWRAKIDPMGMVIRGQ